MAIHARRILRVTGLLAVMASPALAASPAPVVPSPLPSAAPVSPAPSPDPSATSTPSPSASPFAIVSRNAQGTLSSSGGTWQADVPALIGGPDPAVTAAVNAAIEAHVKAALAWFDAQPVDLPRRDARLDAGTIDHSVALLDDRLLSLRFLATFSAADAAHPAAVPSTLTFDLSTGLPLALTDLARPEADLLGRLSRLSRADLRARFEEREAPRASIRAGTRPHPRSFTAWAATPGGLEVTFGEYQVGPYSLGMPVVSIPWSDLADLIDPAAPVGSMVASPSTSPSASPAG